jgi:hypothetical protein
MIARARTVALLALALTAVASSARAELVSRGDLFVRFDGDIAPHVLPRDNAVPISVRVEGTIRVPAGSDPPPALRKISIALNSGGHLSAQGLPVCAKSRIASADPSSALAHCGPALVGGGTFTARTAVVGQPAETVPGEILLFNTRYHGHMAILGLVFQRKPLPVNRLVVFHIRHAGGTFGTVITGYLPAALNRNGYLKTISLNLQRTYSFHGRRHAYLSASCSTPKGISVATFPFARTSMGFADGRVLSATLTRSCRVR